MLRFLTAWVGAVVLLEVAWLVIAFVAFRTQALRSVLNAQPEELHLDWQRGWSWFPGLVQLEGFRIRGQDEVDQWYGEAESADLRVGLWPLWGKEIRGHRVRLRGVTFRIRPRLDGPGGKAVDAAHLPPIPGYANPPEPAPAGASAQGGAVGGGERHWAIRLPAIEVDDLREVWVNAGRLAGSGRLRGRLDYVLSGPFETEVTDMEWPQASLFYGGETLSTNLSLGLRGVLGPLKFSECHGDEYFRRLTADLSLRGEMVAGQLLGRHLGRTQDAGLEGTSQVSGTVRVNHGRLEPPTSLQLRSDRLRLRLGEVWISGDASVAVRADAAAPEGSAAAGSVSRMELSLARLRFQHRDDLTEALDSGALSARAMAYDPVLPEGFEDVSLELNVGPLSLPDARVLNGFLPGSIESAFLQGAFHLAAAYKRTRHGEGRGHLRIEGDTIRLRLRERECGGRLEVGSEFTLSTNRVLGLAASRVAITNLTLSGVRSRKPEGWSGSVDIDRGTIGLEGPRNLVADLRLELLDTRPLVALLREDEDSPAWLRFVPNLKNLKGGTRIEMGPTHTVLRDFRLRGSANELLAQLTLGPDSTDGILYARYGLISAVFDLRDGKSDSSIFGARRAYRRMLAEMKLEPVPDVVPEGEDTEPAPERP